MREKLQRRLFELGMEPDVNYEMRWKVAQAQSSAPRPSTLKLASFLAWTQRSNQFELLCSRMCLQASIQRKNTCWCAGPRPAYAAIISRVTQSSSEVSVALDDVCCERCCWSQHLHAHCRTCRHVRHPDDGQRQLTSGPQTSVGLVLDSLVTQKLVLISDCPSCASARLILSCTGVACLKPTF